MPALPCSLTPIVYLNFSETILHDRETTIDDISNKNKVTGWTQWAHKAKPPIYQSSGYTASLDMTATISVSKQFLIC